MLIMVQNSGAKFRELADRFQGCMGWMISPGNWKTPPVGVRYALDNGAFSAWKNETAWDKKAFLKLVWDHGDDALWVICPDSVGDRDETLRLWDHWYPILKGYPLAFAVQDGMTAGDVPIDAAIVFVGGSTAWKWSSLRMWTSNFPRVHVGRVNTRRQLLFAQMRGAESVDGTGWFRGDKNQLAGLERFLYEKT